MRTKSRCFNGSISLNFNIMAKAVFQSLRLLLRQYESPSGARRVLESRDFIRSVLLIINLICEAYGSHDPHDSS